MAYSPLALPAVDAVTITIMMDNFIDIAMASEKIAQRFPLHPHFDQFERGLPIAEHGFSALLTVKQGDKEGTVLFDTGISPRGILYNMDALEVSARDIQAIILSHGHADHAMGLPGLIKRLGSRHVPLVLHPDAYLERKLVLPNGIEFGLPAPKKSDLQQEHIQIIEEVAPSMLVDGMILISGEIARTTAFEQGLPIQYARHQETWTPDPQIMDDQYAIVHVRDKGLVIVTGCGHAGIINTIRHTLALTGIGTIYAVVGGFHLTGGWFERIIPETVKALEHIGPHYVLRGHCTGWSATYQIASAMPEAFIPNSMGLEIVRDDNRHTIIYLRTNHCRA